MHTSEWRACISPSTFVQFLLVSPSVCTHLSPDKEVALRKSSMCSQVLLANAPKLGPVLTPHKVHGESRGHTSGTKSYILSRKPYNLSPMVSGLGQTWTPNPTPEPRTLIEKVETPS